jgi:uncharacterized membrane protein
MEPLVALILVTAVLAGAGMAGVRRLKPPMVALRGGLAVMFTMTGTAHFVGMRAELVSMVPPSLPAPELLVTVTGVLELAGAAGLLWARTAPWAAAGLAVLLVAIFPANVYAAREEIATAAIDQLLPRTVMQVVFLAATVAIPLHHALALKHDRRASARRGV